MPEDRLIILNNGASSSGKTQDFDSCIRRFESSRPSQSFFMPEILLSEQHDFTEASS